MEDNKIRVGITQGDINGVGYEVILKTFSDPMMLELCTPIIYGSPKVAAYHRKSLDLPTNFSIVNSASEAVPNRLSVVNCTDDEVKVEFSKPDPEAGKAALGALEKAIEEYKAGLIDVIVTAPINKHTIQSEEFSFPGHTEYIEEKLGDGGKALMILMKDDLRVALVTGHIPVREIESLPVTLGATAPKGNYGSLRTKGWELSADFTHRFSNGLGINVMASISDATTYITKGADYLTPWEDRKLGTTYSTGRRYGDIYGFVTDRLFQKEDFVYGADGQIEKITVIYNGTAHTTNKQSSPYPVYQVHYEDNNKLIFAPGDVKFVDLDGDGYITPGTGTNGNPGDQTVIGNSTPRYEYSFRLGADYKGIDFSIFFQGIGKRQIWGSGQLAIPGYNAKEGALPKTFTTDYWTEERTDAFYPRAWNLGGSNTGFSMQKQSRYLLDMSYLRIKNITLGYTFPENLLSKVYISKARLYMSLENFFTFDKLNGLPIDPEAISGYSMFRSDSNYNLGRTGMGTPVFKTLSCGVQLTF